MKINKKIILLGIILLVINILFKGIFPGKSPNSISLEEINILRNIGYYPAIGDYIFRYASVFLSALIPVLSFYLIFRLAKNYQMGLAVGIALTFSPWILVLSRYVNTYIILLFIAVTIPTFLSGNIKRFFLLLVLMLFFKYFFVSVHLLPELSNISVIRQDLFRILDWRNLFFAGDTISSALHIPQTGFFMYLELPLLFVGMYFVYVKNNYPAVKNFINLLLIGGILFFLLISGNTLYTYSGLFIFYCFSVIIGVGYYSFIADILSRKKILISIFIALITINILFYLELFYNHFDKKNSFEWGYAEESVVKYLILNKQIKNIYASKEAAGKLNHYLTFFGHDKFAANIISGDKLSGTCLKNDTSICILREQDLSLLHLEKDDIKMQFRHFDGLPMYFLIPNR